MAYISKSGIQVGSIIKSDHVLRIINALDGTDEKDLSVMGTVSATYLAGNGSQITNVTASSAATASYITTAQTASYVLNAISSSYSSTVARSYGVFSDSTTQYITQANTPLSWSFNTTEEASGVSVQNNTQITVSKTGVYNLQFSAQVEKSDPGSDDCTIWLRKDGSDVARSATDLTLPANGSKVVAAWNFVLSMNSGSYAEILWSSADTSMYLFATGSRTSPTRPALPSVILTVTQIA